MAQTVRPEAVAAAFAHHLQPGEILRHAVYGREVAFGKLLAVIFASLIPAVLIAYFLVGPPNGLLSWLTYSLAWAGLMIEPIKRIARDYLVGLTDRRLILVQVQTPTFNIDLNKQKNTQTWPLVNPPPIQGSAGNVFARLAILDPRRTVRMRIGYVGQSGAKYQTEAILSILSSPRASASAG